MKRIVTNVVGWLLILLAIGVFLLARPVRKGDYALMAERAVAEYRAETPSVADDPKFKKITQTTERLARWSRAMEGMHSDLREFTAVMLFVTGLIIIHFGSWIPRRDEQQKGSAEQPAGADPAGPGPAQP